ncbi:hypothetical protein KIH39_09820 [Telmatocola sphagniphila]|uniref:Uncharacterized protein n=1 Tax=Telmatocola sphagniphila TaxID=1123043 RepID=A0A8E6F069_9BACT|nr:hypothetical protein [Telmatocola sphagniphila]QVL34181.1 hypothetical protein KIH39_09820 [Telmatocola sphagniphila]
MLLHSTPYLFGLSGSFYLYWQNFLNYWTHVLVTENGIVSIVLLLGAVGIFIITRGRWRR